MTTPKRCTVRHMTKEVPNNIKKLRKAANLTQSGLAEIVVPETSAQQIQRLENGERRLTDEWMARISKALGCEPSDLMNFDKPDAGNSETVDSGDYFPAEVDMTMFIDCLAYLFRSLGFEPSGMYGTARVRQAALTIIAFSNLKNGSPEKRLSRFLESTKLTVAETLRQDGLDVPADDLLDPAIQAVARFLIEIDSLRQQRAG